MTLKKTHKHNFATHPILGQSGKFVYVCVALVGQSSQGRTPPIPGTNGTKWRFYCGIRQRTEGLSQGRAPIRPREGSCLSQGQFLFVPDTVPPKMFMFIANYLFFRRRTNVQQLTCNIDLSCSFYFLFFSFVLLELKPFVLKGKVLGEKF